MESAPLYSEVRLQIHDPKQLELACDVLNGKVTVTQAAEELGQDICSFYGDADLLVVDSSNCSEDAANHILQERIIPLLASTNVTLEFLLKSGKLSTETILQLSDAIKENTSLVGFAVEDIENGELDDVAEAALKYACIRTSAPIKWYQGQIISEAMLEAREVTSRHISPRNSSLSSSDVSDFTPVEVTSQNSQQDRSDDSPDPVRAPRSHRKRPEQSQKNSNRNERQMWLAQTKEKLRSFHTNANEEELEAMLQNMELFRLQQTIDYHLLGIEY